MPSPTYPIPAGISVLQVYRHLLRECSYLPPAIRAVITKTIQTRFRTHQHRDARPKAHIARAKTTLRNLRAANSGDKRTMESLISKGFGRTGSRRRELMSRFVLSQGPSNSQTLEALLDTSATKGQEKVAGQNRGQEAGQIPGQGQGQEFKDAATSATVTTDAPAVSKKAFYEKWDQQKLLRALKSQKKQQVDSKTTASWRSNSVGSLNPDQAIPTKTIWGKPPSEIIVRAKRSDWWRRSAVKILPPLGKGEWDLLSKLSQGGRGAEEWAVPERRAHGESREHDAAVTSTVQRSTTTSPRATTRISNWLEYAERPASIVEKPKSLSHQRRSGQKDNNPYGVRDRDRSLSPRWFQRAYNRTWQLTPMMEQDPNTLRYSFTWGKAGSKLPCATKLQSEIFDGVDSRGRALPAR